MNEKDCDPGNCYFCRRAQINESAAEELQILWDTLQHHFVFCLKGDDSLAKYAAALGWLNIYNKNMELKND